MVRRSAAEKLKVCACSSNILRAYAFRYRVYVPCTCVHSCFLLHIASAIALMLQSLLATVEPEAVSSRFLSILVSLSKDAQDSVRLLAAGVCPAMARALQGPAAEEQVLPVFKAAAAVGAHVLHAYFF